MTVPARAVGYALLAVLLGTAGACRPSSSEKAVSIGQNLPSCWKLELSATGIENDSVRDWLPKGTLPSRIKLDTALHSSSSERGDSTFVAYSLFDGRHEKNPFSVWTRMRGDSIRVQQAGARTGIMLRLTRSDDRLVGTVNGYSDVGRAGRNRSPRKTPIAATRVSCPDAEGS